MALFYVLLIIISPDFACPNFFLLIKEYFFADYELFQKSVLESSIILQLTILACPSLFSRNMKGQMVGFTLSESSKTSSDFGVEALSYP